MDANNNDIGIHYYVYALGTHIARVDGVIGDTQANVYYYHTDNIGSIKAVTDQSGNVVFNAKYEAFGTQYGKNTYSGFDEWHGFNGKEFDRDTGLYYYNARWYDSDIGRFISEDPAADPNNPNLYSYCANNPLSKTDPTGLYWQYSGRDTYTWVDDSPPAGPTPTPDPNGGVSATPTPPTIPNVTALGIDGLTNYNANDNSDKQIVDAMNGQTATGIQIIGPPDFVKNTFASIQKLTSDKLEITSDGYVRIVKTNDPGKLISGTDLIRKLTNDSKQNNFAVTIIPGNLDGSVKTAYYGTVPINGRVITFNPDQSVPWDKISNHNPVTTPQIGIGHELIHSFHWMKGDFDPSRAEDNHGANGAEQQAIGWGKYKNETITENTLRNEQPDHNKRTSY